jgi:hypothetical protein
MMKNQKRKKEGTLMNKLKKPLKLLRLKKSK